ncbi:hypothetical protein TthSNM66_18290 [Thermus thermophilus]|uniref:hypothetical protein n=1 Tax=Thermus thermophilus TaxID=274 RepID=UPI001FCB2548|nr:hypothetical protein [Thermus thermophilus]BDG27193.1 hypothetical protein TthSNM66_18290 [Thermus thermophilus]
MNLLLAPTPAEAPPLPLGTPELTHLPMTSSGPAVALVPAEAPPLAPLKVDYWLADLFVAPGRAYARGYREGYEAALRECAGGGNAYHDRPRSIYEFQALFKPDPELFAALLQRYGNRGQAKRPLGEWLALMASLRSEL